MSIVDRINLENRKSFHWNLNQFMAIGLSIGLGLALGYLSSQGNWLYAIILAFFGSHGNYI